MHSLHKALFHVVSKETTVDSTVHTGTQGTIENSIYTHKPNWNFPARILFPSQNSTEQPGFTNSYFINLKLLI